MEKLKETIKKVVNAPAPVGKTVLVAGTILCVSFLLTHKMKVILVFG